MVKRLLLLNLSFVFLSIFFSCSKEQVSEEKDSNYFFPLTLFKEAEHNLRIANNWLIENQLPDYSWNSNPAITSLVLYALAETPGYPDLEGIDEVVDNGIKYLEKFIQEDGGIYENEYRNYTTAVALLAFTSYADKKYSDVINNAKDFLIKFQSDESENISQDNAFFGGIGYGGDDRPDLSNTQLALEAIKAAEDFDVLYSGILPKDAKTLELETNELGLHWGKALVFLARCQNLSEINDMPYRVSDDGGFMYETGTYSQDRSHSYGSMTYAGVKSLLFAQVDKSDIRVVRALDWIRNNYTLEENPGFGTTSLYYYYMTFSKCMQALETDKLTSADGVEHYWREEIVGKLLSLQHEEGYWVNDDGRYWENTRTLTTSYAILAIKFAFKGLTEEDIE